METRVVALPHRRERILPVPDHTIGPFDFLATIGCRLSEVIAGLNALGVSPRDMIDILKSIKAAGALHAEFVVR